MQINEIKRGEMHHLDGNLFAKMAAQFLLDKQKLLIDTLCQFRLA